MLAKLSRDVAIVISKAFLAALIALFIAGRAGRAAADCKVYKLAELPVSMAGLRPLVSAKIKGQDVQFLADSGAFFSMLSPRAVKRFGMYVHNMPFGMFVGGVGGLTDAGVTTTNDFTFSGAPYHDIDFLVGGDALFNDGVVGLLGRNLLTQVDAEFDLSGGAIRLFKTSGCGNANLAYWSGAKPQSIMEVDIDPTEPAHSMLMANATVNGRRIRVLFDSGAPRSILKLSAAARAGVNPTSPGVVDAGMTSGLGRREMDTWNAPFDSFALGDEQVQHLHLLIGAIELDDADMLLGADFFLSHRLYFSVTQHRLYFTWNGGPIFDLGQRAIAGGPQPAPAQVGSSQAPPPSSGSPSTAQASPPGDAEGFARLGEASAARRDFIPAIDDFTRAMALDPTNADYAYRRALARIGARRPVLAMADLDEALKLKPDDVAALMVQGELLLFGGDASRAKADFDAALKAGADEPMLAVRIANAYQRKGIYPEALAHYDAWIAANPGDDRMADVLNERCWTRALWGQELDKALVDCDRALRLRSGQSEYLNSRALVRLRQGDLDHAIADYDAALRLQPKDAWSLYGRGLAESRKGETAQASADLAAATALAPGLPDHAKQLGLTP